jgi:hypothetical protein
MMCRRSFRMHFQKVVQNVEQSQHVLAVAALLGASDIFDNHVSHLCATLLGGQKIFGQRCGHNFRDVLVLGDGKHRFFGQATEVDAVL